MLAVVAGGAVLAFGILSKNETPPPGRPEPALPASAAPAKRTRSGASASARRSTTPSRDRRCADMIAESVPPPREWVGLPVDEIRARRMAWTVAEDLALSADAGKPGPSELAEARVV